MPLAELLVFPMFLLFIRVGTAVMVFPGFADSSVNPRTRLLIAVVITTVLYPLLQTKLPALPTSTSLFIWLMLTEFMVGLLYAISARLFMAAINVAGEMIAFASGFQAATLFDPDSGSNTIAPAVFLQIAATLLIFVLNLHHVMIEGIVESYRIFPPGEMPPMGDSIMAVLRTVGDVFETGIKMAAPVMVAGFLGYMGFGIFNRLIPQLHAFFVAIPIILTVGVMMLGVSLGAMLTLFMTELAAHQNLFIVNVTAPPAY